MSEWDHKDEWRMRGDNFMVTVTRHTVSIFEMDEGPNRWAVYAYIYPDHPHFHKFDGKSIYQDACNAMPLHAGASLVRWHKDDDGKICSVQVGADYNHLYDAHYTLAETKVDASSVFFDASKLFTWLMNEAAKNREST
jgi:hypothetical protein